MLKEKLLVFITKIKAKAVDHYHILFKSAAENHLRIQELIKNSDGTYQLTVKFGSYSELKNYQKKMRRLTVSLSSAMAMVIVAFIVAPYIMNPSRSSAANFLWSQTSWDSSATSAATISRAAAGTTFQSMDANIAITTPAPGDSALTLSTMAGSKSQSYAGDAVDGFNLTGSNFDSGKVAISPAPTTGGQGVDGAVQLAQSSAGTLTQTDDTAVTASSSSPQGGWNNRGSQAFSSTTQNGTIGTGASVNLTQVGGSVTPMVLTGGVSTVALKSDGTVWWWGGLQGTVGANSLMPVRIESLSNITKIFESKDATTNNCALSTTGELWCWGANAYGQIGTGTAVQTPIPFLVNNSSRQIPAVLEVVIGERTACLIDVNQEVWCWGNDNQNGVLGNGSLAVNLNPAKIANFTGIKKVDMYAYSNACALKNDNSIWCWGSGSYGQLGNGALNSSYVPILVSAGTDNVDFVMNNRSECSLKSNGDVYCWGSDNYGSLGLGVAAGTTVSIPTKVAGVSGIAKLYAAGGAFTVDVFALRETDGTVWSWGDDTYGELGNDAPLASQNVPVQVAGLSGVTMISIGISGAPLALKNDDTVWGWGTNFNGSLGNGTTTNPQPTPTQVHGLNNQGFLNAAAIYGYGSSRCAATVNGTLYCWGYNGGGKIGNNLTVDLAYPVNVISGLGAFLEVQSVSGGIYSAEHACAVRTDGAVFCWGDNHSGDLGIGTNNGTTTAYNKLPERVKDAAGTGYFAGALQINVGSDFTCALKTDGTVWCWGSNLYGQLGDGSTVNKYLPVQVKDLIDGSGFLTNVSQIDVGYAYVCARKNDNTVSCWGRNDFGQLGINAMDSSAHTSAVQVKDSAGTGFLVNVAKITTGNTTTCSVQIDGSAYCWGAGTSGILGSGTTTTKILPYQVKGVNYVGLLSNVSDISIGATTACARMQDGSVACWGSNLYGQLGQNTTDSSNHAYPLPVKDALGTGLLSGVANISAAAYNICATGNDGSVSCWGGGSSGALGNGATANKSLPTKVSNVFGSAGDLVGVAKVQGGFYKTCAILQDKTLRCWGKNSYGQLGDGNGGGVEFNSYPVVVLNPANNTLFALSGGYNGQGTYVSFMDAGAGSSWKDFKFTKHGSLNGIGTTSVNVRVKSSADGNNPPSDLSTTGCNFVSGLNEGIITGNMVGCAGSERYLWYKATLNASIDLSESPLLEEVIATSSISYQTAGNYTSAIIDTGQKNVSWGNFTLNTVQIAGAQTLSLKVRSCVTADCSAENTTKSLSTFCSPISITGAVTTAALTSATPNNCVTAGDRYIQYQAAFAGDSSSSAKLNDILLNFNAYPTTFQKLLSSPYNTTNTVNSMQKLTWTAGNDTTDGTVKFQIRTSPDNVTWGEWCGPTACDAAPGGGISDFYTDKLGVTDINATQKDHNSDQWIQYATFLKSNSGDIAPTLSDVTMQYAYNVPPEVTIDTDPTKLKQYPDGSFHSEYTVSETYDDLNKIMHGTPSAAIKTALLYRSDAGITAPELTDTQTGTITFNNASSSPIPKQGTMLIDKELLTFDDAAGTLTGNQRNILARHVDLAASYPTTATTHANNAEVFFLAPTALQTVGGCSDGTCDALAEDGTAGAKTTTPTKVFVWNPRADVNSNLTGNNLTGLELKVIAHDADSFGFNTIGSAQVSAQTLDLQAPTITSITTDEAHTATGADTLYLNKNSTQIPLTVNFSENINFDATGGKIIVLTLNSGTCTIATSIVNSNVATCQYVIGADEKTPTGEKLKLNTPFVAATAAITDNFTNTLTNFTPAANLDAVTNIVIDNLAPTANDLTDIITKDQFTSNNLNAQDSDGSGIATYAWSKVSGPGDITFGSDAASQTTISANTDGIYVLQVVITDNSGNATTKTLNLIWDTTKPTNVAKPNVPSLTNDNTPTITWDQFTDTNGLTKYEVQRKTDTVGDNFATIQTITDTTTLETGSPSFTDSTLADDTYFYQIIATDKAGNVQTSPASDAMTVDTIAPTLLYFYSTSPDSIVGDPTASGDINLVAVYDEAVATGNVQVRVGPMSAIVNVTLDQVLETTKLQGSFTIGAPRTGYDTTPDPLKIEQILAQSVSDQAGNVQAQTLATIEDNMNLVARGSSIVIDTTPPILNSFTIENNSVTAFKQQNNAFTLVANYNKTIQANGNVKVKLNTGSGSHEITLTNSAAGKKLTAFYSVQANENANDLKVEAVLEQNVLDGKGAPANYIGNILDGTYATNAGDPVINLSGFQIDTAAPALGATPIAIQNTNGKTGDSTPNITLSATDNLNLSKVIFSLNGGTTWCAPIDYNATINTFDITSSVCGGNTTNGSKTVTVKFADAAGNESAASAASVEFDNLKPQLQTLTTDKTTGIYGPGAVIKIIATYDEAISNGTILINLDSGKQLTLDTIENGNTLTGIYTVGATNSAEDSSKLRVAAIVSQAVSDTADPINTQDGTSLAGITENLDSNKTIQIDTTAPIASQPAGFFKLDRASENEKIKVIIKPDDYGVDMTDMGAQIKLQDNNGACDFTGAATETLSGQTTFTYDDTNSSIKKACLKLTDKVGNVSGEIVALTPSTPENFAYTDLTSATFTGSILKWDIPTVEGTGNFKQYNVLHCEGVDCAPTQNQGIENKNQNYQVFKDLNGAATYCYGLTIQDNNGDISRVADKVCYAPGAGPVLTDTEVAFESDPYVGNIAKTSASVIFKTVDAADGNSALATTAEVNVYDDAGLTNLIKTANDTLSVTHAVNVAGLEENKTYYLKITATDSSVESNPNRSETVQYLSTVPEKYIFTTAGVLSSITNIKEAIITGDKAVITFNTNQNAKCLIDSKDSLSSVYNNLADNLETGFFTNHSITLNNLIEKTAYDYKITCVDDGTASIMSDEHHFTTQEKGLTQGEMDAMSDNTAPVISSVSLDKVTGESATITWNTDEVANSLVAYETEGASYTLMSGDYTVNADVTKYSTAHSVIINGIIPASKYTFSVISTDVSGNIAQSAEAGFTSKEPSSLSSIKVLSKALGQATVTWTTGQATSSLVEYGLSMAYGQTKQDNSKVKEHSILLSDLTPGETYHFRVKGEDEQKNVFASSDITFQPKAPPKISDFKIDEITEHGATVKFNTNVSTDALVSFTNTDDDKDAGVQGRPDYVSKHEIKLAGLTSGASFSVKLKVRDEDGNETEETFANFTTTKDENPPVIDRVKTDAALTQTDKVQAIISWTTDEMSTGEVIYKEGKTGDEKKFEVNSSPSFSHIGVITSFKAGVVYYFKVKSIDQAGNVANSTDYAVLTPKKRQNIIQVIIGNFTDIFGWAKF
ncbi:MAG: hypothetical protein HGA36_01525 [Candidatus Moranbacteria bacterium]|nr:hypothetical protein [Candidatus Moranbacteria bacterium]